MAIGPMQAKFIQEYIKLGNATKAAIVAGYKESNARRQATWLLSKAHIRKKVLDERNAIAERALISAARTLREISFLAFSDIGDILDFSGEEPRLKRAMDIPLRARRSIASVKVKRVLEGTGDDARQVELIEFKLWDKSAALDKLAKHLALFVDQEEIEKLRRDVDEIKGRKKREADNG